MHLVTLEDKHISIIYVLAKTVMTRKHGLMYLKDKTLRQDFSDKQGYPLILKELIAFYNKHELILYFNSKTKQRRPELEPWYLLV